MPEDKAQGDILRGQQAHFILDHPLYKAAFDELERELFEQLADVNMHDRDSQKELLRTVKNLRRLRGVMQAHIGNGRLAADLLKRGALQRTLNVIGF